MTASPAIASARNRRYKRVPTPETFQATWQCPGIREICQATDLNMGGVFLVTDKVQSEGMSLKIKIPNPGGDIAMNGVVRDAAQNGMGVEFVALGAKERVKLDLLVKKLMLCIEKDEGERKNAPRIAKPAPIEASAEPGDPKKRKFLRVNLPKGLKVAWTYGKQNEMTIAGTVSIGGLFVISQWPAPVGSNVRLLFEIPGGVVLATAVVRNLVPGRGMGIEFTEIRPEDRARLDGLLNRLIG